MAILMVNNEVWQVSSHWVHWDSRVILGQRQHYFFQTTTRSRNDQNNTWLKRMLDMVLILIPAALFFAGLTWSTLCLYIHSYANVCAYYVYTHMHRCMHTHPHIYIDIYIYRYIYMFMYRYMCIHDCCGDFLGPDLTGSMRWPAYGGRSSFQES